jgi:hypothetical protein
MASLANTALVEKCWYAVASDPAVFRRFDALRRPPLIGFILTDRGDQLFPRRCSNLRFVPALRGYPNLAETGSPLLSTYSSTPASGPSSSATTSSPPTATPMPTASLPPPAVIAKEECPSEAPSRGWRSCARIQGAEFRGSGSGGRGRQRISVGRREVNCPAYGKRLFGYVILATNSKWQKPLESALVIHKTRQTL